MKKIVLLICCIFSLSLHAQDKSKDEAYKLAQEAIKLMDNGDLDGAVDLLEQSYELDPQNYIYPYEIGYAYILKKKYDKAIQIYERVVEMDNINDQCYQMLGNAYSMNEEKEKALDAYERGLIRFPNSGRLYLEIGNIHNNDQEALVYYEKGIQLDPSFPSNYYWASKIYCNTDCEIWGLLYGELFMNLERGSDRTVEISKLIYDTYKSEITITSDTSISVSFCKNILMDPNAEIVPFSLVYETSIIASIVGIKTISLASLNTIRGTFISRAYKSDAFKHYQLNLFDWHQKLIKEGWFECYNYWLMMQGNQEEFDTWYSANEEKFETFLEWFGNNPMPVTDENTISQLKL